MREIRYVNLVNVMKKYNSGVVRVVMEINIVSKRRRGLLKNRALMK